MSNSSSVHNHDKENSLADQTIAELRKFNIPPTPQCYEVMYCFLKQDNMEVTKAVKKHLNDHDGVLNEACLLKIHTSILSYDTIARTVNIVTNLLNRQINSLNYSVSNSDEELNVFSEAIDTFQNYCVDDASSDQNIINYINEATTRIKNKVVEIK